MSDPDWTKNFIRPTVAAGVLFTDEQDRVLMVVPSYKDYLDIPGGYVEHGETPHQAAQREVFEELGIKPPIGHLLIADWWEDSPENGLGAKLLLVFDGGRIAKHEANQVEVDGMEISGTKFVQMTDLNQVTIPRLSNRILRALEARNGPNSAYLENGRAIDHC